MASSQCKSIKMFPGLDKYLHALYLHTWLGNCLLRSLFVVSKKEIRIHFSDASIWHFWKKNLILIKELIGLPWWLSGKESVCRYSRHRFDVWVGKIPGRQKWQPTLVFLPGKSCGQRSLGVYSPPVCKRVGHNLASKQQQSLWKSTKSIYQLLILSEISVPVFFRHYLWIFMWILPLSL